MMTKGKDQFEEDTFEAFLQGRDELSRHLQSLPQPEPSAALDATILARVKADLARTAVPLCEAANDPAMPDAAKIRPNLLTRWRMPLALAASVLLTCVLLLRWPSQPDNPPPLVVAQAQQDAPQVAAVPAPAMVVSSPVPPAAKGSSALEKPKEAKLPAKPSAEEKGKPRESAALPGPQIANAPGTATDTEGDAMSPIQMAQADSQEYSWRAAAPAPVLLATPAQAPAISAAPARPPMADAAVASSANPEKAKAWLALIEELLKAGLHQDALAEWKNFRKAYPQYPVPEKLEARIKVLKE